MSDKVLVVSCEHATNHVPKTWLKLFQNLEVLDTHLAWDPGALELAKEVAEQCQAPCFEANITRLLIDHNRSPGHFELWSTYSRDLPGREKSILLHEYYDSFRKQVRQWIEDQLKKGLPITHISIHTFTPILHGRKRSFDIGILYDTGRIQEQNLALALKQRMLSDRLPLKVRFNAPYQGQSDCHQTYYRRRFSDDDYSGIELEINQSLVATPKWPQMKHLISKSIASAL